MLDKHKLLEAAFNGIQSYVEKYNDENGSQVYTFLDTSPEASDHGIIEVDGGNAHGGWTLTLGEL